jgi:hypothetical protein
MMMLMMVNHIITFTPSSIVNDVLVNHPVPPPVGAIITPVGDVPPDGAVIPPVG